MGRRFRLHDLPSLDGLPGAKITAADIDGAAIAWLGAHILSVVRSHQAGGAPTAGGPDRSLLGEATTVGKPGRAARLVCNPNSYSSRRRELASTRPGAVREFSWHRPSHVRRGGRLQLGGWAQRPYSPRRACTGRIAGRVGECSAGREAALSPRPERSLLARRAHVLPGSVSALMPALKFFFWRGEVREPASHDGCRWVVSEHVRRFLSLDSRDGFGPRRRAGRSSAVARPYRTRARQPRDTTPVRRTTLRLLAHATRSAFPGARHRSWRR